MSGNLSINSMGALGIAFLDRLQFLLQNRSKLDDDA